MFPSLNNIMIVGCGNIGAYLVYSIAIKSLKRSTFDTIYLVDPDYLEPKNLPYIFGINFSKYLNYPKIFALESLFQNHIRNKPKIVSLPINYSKEECFQNENVFMIDCRDNYSKESEFHLKLNLDGQYGIINFGNQLIKSTENARYIIGRVDYYSLLFSNIVLNLLDNLPNNVGKCYFADLTNFMGGLYEYPTNSSQ